MSSEPGKARAEDTAGAHDTSALAQAASRGDAERFGELYTRVAPALFAWTELRILPHMRAHLDATDVVQEVWTRALRSFGAFDPARHEFRPWIFGVAKNVLLEAYRHASRSPIALLGVGPSTKLGLIEQCPESVTAHTRAIARDESLRRFLELVAAREPLDRHLIVYCGLEGLSVTEVAQRLGLSREAAFKRWQRLRDELGQGRVAPASLLVEPPN